MPDDNKEILKRLEDIAEKIETLTSVVAVSSNLQTALQGKNKSQQIWFLYQLGLPNEIVAQMTGSTPGSVRSTVSQIKSGKIKV